MNIKVPFDEDVVGFRDAEDGEGDSNRLLKNGFHRFEEAGLS